MSRTGTGRHIRLPEVEPRCEPRGVTARTWDPPYDRFRATADAVAQVRPEVDLELAREIFDEVATSKTNGC